jgi:hypothetical protein
MSDHIDNARIEVHIRSALWGTGKDLTAHI